MGTDIHPVVEVRRKGIWRSHKPKTLCRWYTEVYTEDEANEVNRRIAQHPEWKQRTVKAGDRRNPWDRCKYRLPECFRDRNYIKFAILGNVRNGHGFAGIATHESVPFISDRRGFPADMATPVSRLTGDHSETWVDLQELLDYDFTQPLYRIGVISEAQFIQALVNRADPESWSGDITGPNIKVVTPEQYAALHGELMPWGNVDPKTKTYDPTKSYYIRYRWTVPLAQAAGDILEMIEYLTPLIPKGGTAKDVRVVMNFDS